MNMLKFNKHIISINLEIKDLQILIKRGKSLIIQFPNDKILTRSITQHELRLKELQYMKKILLLLMCFTFSLLALAQSRRITDDEINKSGASQLIFIETKEEAHELAKKDISKGLPFILLKSGIAPVVYPKDSIFQYKYKVFYKDYGCAGPAYELMEAYNFVMFSYFYENYGKKWRKEVRTDAIGFRTWDR